MMSALVTLMADFWNLLLGDADEKMNAAMAAVDANIRPEISEADQQAITDAINAGIAAADKVFDIQASVDTDIDDFTAELDAVFADDKFTKKELKNLQNTLNGQVDDAISAATAHVEEKREEYKQTLLSLVDDNGQPVYTEAAAEILAAAMSEKTAELTAELDQARIDLNTLLNTIYASKTDPTQEQLDNINALLDQIGVLEVKLGTLQDQAVKVAMAKTGRVKRGEGTDEDFGVAIGFTGEMYRQQTTQITADADARLVALQAVADADGATQETIDAAYVQMDAVYGETALAHQAAAQSYNDEMLALYNGMAEQYPNAARTISNIADLSGTLNEVSSLTTTLGSMDAFDPAQLSTFMEQLTTMYTDFYGMDIPAGDMEQLLDPFTFATTASELLSTFNDDIAGLIESNAAGLDDNPMMLYLQTMLENGSFDNLDITKVDGALKDVLELIDFVARGEEAGTQLVEGVNGGIGGSGGGPGRGRHHRTPRSYARSHARCVRHPQSRGIDVPDWGATGRRHPVQHAGANRESRRYGILYCRRYCGRGTTQHGPADRHPFYPCCCRRSSQRGGLQQRFQRRRGLWQRRVGRDRIHGCSGRGRGSFPRVLHRQRSETCSRHPFSVHAVSGYGRQAHGIRRGGWLRGHDAIRGHSGCSQSDYHRRTGRAGRAERYVAWQGASHLQVQYPELCRFQQRYPERLPGRRDKLRCE